MMMALGSCCLVTCCNCLRLGAAFLISYRQQNDPNAQRNEGQPTHGRVQRGAASSVLLPCGFQLVRRIVLLFPCLAHHGSASSAFAPRKTGHHSLRNLQVFLRFCSQCALTDVCNPCEANNCCHMSCSSSIQIRKVVTSTGTQKMKRTNKE
jgi:hypothetical protein